MSRNVFRIRRAIHGDEDKLTELSFASKRYWRYPDHYYTVWQSELTITRNYLEQNTVYLVERNAVILGYYSLVQLDEDLVVQGHRFSRGYWLDHMFVQPECIGSGIGTRLFTHLCNTCRIKKATDVKMLADPYAQGFYEKMGCEYIRDCPSTIKGRTTPLLKKDLLSPA